MQLIYVRDFIRIGSLRYSELGGADALLIPYSTAQRCYAIIRSVQRQGSTFKCQFLPIVESISALLSSFALNDSCDDCCSAIARCSSSGTLTANLYDCICHIRRHIDHNYMVLFKKQTNRRLVKCRFLHLQSHLIEITSKLRCLPHLAFTCWSIYRILYDFRYQQIAKRAMFPIQSAHSP